MKRKLNNLVELIISLGFSRTDESDQSTKIFGAFRLRELHDDNEICMLKNTIVNNYSEEFQYTDVSKDLHPARSSRLFAMEIFDTHYEKEKRKESVVLGYAIISDKYAEVEKFLDVLLCPEYVGINLMARITKYIVHYAYSIGCFELFAWTKNKKNILEKRGYRFLDNDEDNLLYSLDVIDYLKNLYK